MVQSNQYDDQDEIAYLADFPGADPDENRILVAIPETVAVENTNEEGVDPATEGTLSSILDTVATQETLNALARALGSNNDDTIIIQQDSPLDVSDATVTITEDGPVDVSAATVTVTEEGPVDVSASTVPIQEDSPLDVSGATVTIQDDGPLDVSGETVTVTQSEAITLAENNATNIGKVRVMDSDGVLTNPIDSSNLQPTTSTTSTAGSADAATLDLGPHRRNIDVFYDVSGTAVVTVEVSTDGDTWREHTTESLDSASTGFIQVETSYQHTRAYADQNLNTIEMSSKGS